MSVLASLNLMHLLDFTAQHLGIAIFCQGPLFSLRISPSFRPSGCWRSLRSVCTYLVPDSSIFRVDLLVFLSCSAVIPPFSLARPFADGHYEFLYSQAAATDA